MCCVCVQTLKICPNKQNLIGHLLVASTVSHHSNHYTKNIQD